MLVLRAPYLTSEARTLLRSLRFEVRRLAIIVTFADKVSSDLGRATHALETRLGVPVVTIDARELTAAHRSAILDAIRTARPLASRDLDASPLVQLRARPPARTLFEHPTLGPLVAVVAMTALLAVPVACAFHLSSWLQPYADAAVIGPITQALEGLWPPLAAILIGPYGLLTLGSYSFLWAFPVVLLLGIASSLAEETGLHDRITAALDPWLRHVGLSGRAGAMAPLSRILGAVFGFFHLPEETSLAVVFSVLRKDGMLLLNTSNGSLLRSLSGGQVFGAVYLASTLTPCLVTLAAVRRELGWAAAGNVAGRQALTSVISTWILSQLAW
ncbi:MAG: hypothetical protein KIT84_40930 [Labilithrix sp.]|nr:hypothetical protein [Labilithrix sp.]MCW5817435.1 hypothetical protein [Labilithrix sp.]